MDKGHLLRMAFIVFMLLRDYTMRAAMSARMA